MSFYIKKMSGEREEFNLGKFKRSLYNSGADDALVEKVAKKIKYKRFRSTDEVYNFAYNELASYHPGVAARYNLKRALLDFGPSGYPFEKFIGRIFIRLEYQTQIDQVLQGRCVAHEIDLILKKGDERILTECKFHNSQKIKCEVKVPLYIRARFEDVTANKDVRNSFTNAMIVTNTKFTDEALAYATCMKMELLSWDYPQKDGLAQLIDRFGLHPITVLGSLSNKQKAMLLHDDVVLCEELLQKRNLLDRIGIRGWKVDRVFNEINMTCKIK